jgi:hypothetical protein
VCGVRHENPPHIIAAALDFDCLSLSTPRPASQPASQSASQPSSFFSVDLSFFPFHYRRRSSERSKSSPTALTLVFFVVFRSGEFLWETRKSILTRSSIAWSQVRGTGHSFLLSRYFYTVVHRKGATPGLRFVLMSPRVAVHDQQRKAWSFII